MKKNGNCGETSAWSKSNPDPYTTKLFDFGNKICLVLEEFNGGDYCVLYESHLEIINYADENNERSLFRPEALIEKYISFLKNKRFLYEIALAL